MRDPVCDRYLEEVDVLEKSTFEGHPYSFCSAECKQKFDANPRSFIRFGFGRTIPTKERRW